MSEIITNDPMIQKAREAEQMDRAVYAMAKQIEMGVTIAVFSQLALDHATSGDELNLEAGREIAMKARQISAEYSGFILESHGLATMSKQDA